MKVFCQHCIGVGRGKMCIEWFFSNPCEQGCSMQRRLMRGNIIKKRIRQTPAGNRAISVVRRQKPCTRIILSILQFFAHKGVMLYLTVWNIKIFQVVGNRGTIEINPRETMAKESSILGVMLGQASEVQNSKNSFLILVKLWVVRYNHDFP